MRTDEQITAMQRELNRREEQIAGLSRELAVLYASKSWRLTSPMRRARLALTAARSRVRRAVGALFRLLPRPVREMLRFRLRQDAQLLRESGQFDGDYYLRQNPGVAAAGLDPVVHYLTAGADAGRNPSREFDTAWYASQSKGDRSGNPLVHYVRRGRREGREPLPPWAFDPRDPDYHVALPAGGEPDGPPTRGGEQLRLAVHLHVYYLDSLDIVLRHLQSIPRSFDLFVTSDSEESLTAVRARLAETHPGLEPQMLVCPNVGRDIGPMLVSLGETLLGYDLALHLHVKRSQDKADPEFGHHWMIHNLDCMLRDTRLVHAILSLFEAETECGIIHPKPYPPIVPELAWGANREIVMDVLERLDVDASITDVHPLVFPAGNMFWFRPAALHQLLSGAFQYGDFPPEPIPADGTLAHALERTMVYLARGNGFTHHTVFACRPEVSRPLESLPELSVVIPVYNAERTLPVAIQSVLQQDPGHPTFEIILVDDGSTDGSRRIASHYADCFPQIRVLTQENQGAGAARNVGIANARAEHVTFVDADDALSPRALSRLHKAIQAHDADVVVSRLRMFDESFVSAPMPVAYGRYGELLDLRAMAADGAASDGNPEIAHQELQALFSDFGPCAKIYRKAFLLQQGIRFPEGVNYEDNAFVYDAYLSAARLLAIADTTYLYRRHRDREGATQSTRTDLSAVRDQIDQLRQLSAKTTEITNADLQRIACESIVNKIVEMIDEQPAVLVHMRTLKSDLEQLLETLDARGAFRSSHRLKQYLLL